MKTAQPRGPRAHAERVAQVITAFTGSTPAFLIAAGIIALWAALGPVFGYSDTWQLVINTGTTIVTFLMVFLIQRTQNKDSLAIQLKLNELVASHQGASNRLISVEDLTEKDLAVLREHYCRLAEMSQKMGDILSSHSIEEAENRHGLKHGRKVALPASDG